MSAEGYHEPAPEDTDRILQDRWRTYMDQGYGDGRHPFSGEPPTRTTYHASIEGDGDPMFRQPIDSPPSTVEHGEPAE